MANNVFPKGRCVAGDACKFPNLWLRPQDKCPDCLQIVHPSCGIVPEDGKSITCQSCADSKKDEENDTATKVTECESVTITDATKKASINIETKEIVTYQPIESPSLISTITASKDKSQYTSIEKDYFIKTDQCQNTDAKKRDGDIWKTLRKAVIKEIDADLKAMMILRSQEVGLKVKDQDEEKLVSSWNEIGEAWRNDDSIDTAKKLYEIIHATFDDKSGYEIYMESSIMDRLQLKYNEEEGYKNKGCIARMIITQKSELNKLINKRSEASHQKKFLARGHSGTRQVEIQETLLP